MTDETFPVPMTEEEFLILSQRAREQRNKEDYARRVVFYQQLELELQRIFPEVSIYYSSRVPTYKCRICGSMVLDRVTHLRYHRGTDMLEVLTSLFGRPN